MIRVNLWSGPRNVSTAMMYSFAQRPDTRVVDEPLYAHYLYQTGIIHPGREAILAAQSVDGREVIREVILGQYDRPIVFFKQMTHHLLDLPVDFMARTKNILLIRDPVRVLTSYQKVIEMPRLDDIGIRQAAELHRMLTQQGWHVAVLDSADLLLDPSKILQLLCSDLDIPFHEQMLQWEAGPRPEDGIWAQYWYDNVHQSTGFGIQQASEITLNPALQALAQEALPYYEYLKPFAIR